MPSGSPAASTWTAPQKHSPLYVAITRPRCCRLRIARRLHSCRLARASAPRRSVWRVSPSARRRASIVDDFGQRAGIYVVEAAEDVHVPGRAGMRADERGVALERGLVVLDADAATIVERGDVGAVLVPVGLDDAAGREGRRPAMRVMDDDDILDPEQMLGDRDRAERVDGATTGNDDREDGRRRGDTIARGVDDHASGIFLVPEPPGHGLGNLRGPWIVAVDDERLQRHRPGERRARRRLVEGWTRAECKSVELAHLTCSLSRAYAHQ